MDTVYGAADFKAHCLQIIDEVAETGKEIRVTKRGRPLIRILPETAAEPLTAYGFLSGSALIKDDLLETGETWDADHE